MSAKEGHKFKPAYSFQMPADGGAAFPQDGIGGLSTRDYFAAAALQGILSNDSSLAFSHAARDAYIYADAMLAERANQKEAQP